MAEDGKKLVMLLRQAADTMRKQASVLREFKSQGKVYTVNRKELRRLIHGK